MSVGHRRSKGVTKTVVTMQKTGTTTTFESQQEVEKENLKYLARLFTCADNSPLQQPPLLHELGYLGNTTTGDQITEGIYDLPKSIDDDTTSFLSCCQRPPYCNMMVPQSKYLHKAMPNDGATTKRRNQVAHSGNEKVPYHS